MKLRNPEIKGLCICFGLSSVIFSGIGFAFFGIYAGVLILVSLIIVSVIYMMFALARYKRIRQMSESLDRILHGKDTEMICKCREGDLAVLQSEIRKMTVMLREAAENLKKDKIYLTDSIADISHQLRTPLTSINLMLSMLKEPDIAESRRSELMFSLKHMLSRIDWLIETLLKISKIDAGTAFFENGRVSVKTLIDKSAQPLETSLEIHCQQLISTIGDEYFTGDLSWSAEALGNILKNCIEHTPNGGSIYVTCEQTNIFTQITIRDTGSGFDIEDIPHLFDRFYKGKNCTESSVGIGLALAKSIIVQQNGTIKALNHPDGGAQFIIRFYFGVV